VRNVDDLAKVDPKTQAARISHTVGMKKRAEISVRAGERHIHILNPLPEEKPTEKEEEEELGKAEAVAETTEAEKGQEPRNEAKPGAKPEAENENMEGESAQESKN